MKKNHFLLLFAMMCFAGKSFAQQQVTPCYTDQVRKTLIAAHPEILQYEAQLELEINDKLKHIDYSKAARTTTFTDMTDSVNFWYDIPIVVHIIHDFGGEYLSDDDIFNDLVNWNIVYAKENSDTATVIPTFAGLIPNSHTPYIGNPHIHLHLATTDPNGNPTKGITRHRSYLTYYAGEQAKLDDWPPTSYVNIWSVNVIPAAGGFTAAAYAFQPAGAVGDPYGDGILCDFDYMANSDYSSSQPGKTINHEMGHVFNLSHPWGNNNFPQVVLGDDGVDDTPPTWGHNPVGCVDGPSSNDNSLYDTLYATNFYMIYPSAAGGDSLVNYPDTTNAQNIMDYTYCARMFTAGQVARMHAALNSTVAGRNNLWDSTNLHNTGALLPLPDLKPIPDFCATSTVGTTSITNYMSRVNYFTYPNVGIKFTNESWNDTVTNLLWTFTVGATTQTSTSLTADTMKFTEGGWVSLTMQATGNHTGDTSVTWPRAAFVSDVIATPGAGYVEEFSGSDTAKWPMFNYYNNEFKWQPANVGFDDNNSIEYTGFDTRIDPAAGIYPTTGDPFGDFDDMFSIPVDLSSFGSGLCYLNYYYSGASRSSTSADINDTMEIDYGVISTATGQLTWNKLASLGKLNLDNKGTRSTAYTPSSQADWSPMAITIPQAARTGYAVFRFRYRPSVAVGSDLTVPTGTVSSGNNFYIDRINFSEWPAYVNNVTMGNVDVAIVPNPTNGDAFVVVKDADNTTAQITVTDITGKVVYRTSAQVTGNEARVQIPHEAIAVPGMYLVQTITGNQAHTQKLVVE